MKNLQLLDLENISGGVDWQTIRKCIFCTIIIAEIFYLQYQVTYLAGRTGGSNDSCNDGCMYLPMSFYNMMNKSANDCLVNNINTNIC